MGNGLDAGVQQGPLVNSGAVDDVDTLVRLSTEAGRRGCIRGSAV